MPFNGLAVFDAFDGIAEDVSTIIGLISPHEAPLLDALGTSNIVGSNVLHEFLEDTLAPDTITLTESVGSAGTLLTALNTNRWRVGDILMNRSSLDEYFQITAVGIGSLAVARGFGAGSATNVNSGVVIEMVSTAALEGDDVLTDESVGRTRLNNFMQIFKKDIIVSDTKIAVTDLGNVGNEFDYQKQNRMRELLKELNKATIKGVLSGNTIGSASAVRTMRGIRASLTTNITSIATLTDSFLQTAIEGAWVEGGTDLDILVVHHSLQRILSGFNAARVEVGNAESKFRNLVTMYESATANLRIIQDRWMNSGEGFILSTARTKLVPLQKQTFQFNATARTGMAQKGFINGQYTLELKNESGMARFRG